MSNYVGIVNLYDGIFIGHGNSMTASVYVSANKDELVVDVTITNVSYSRSIPAGGTLSSPPGFNGLWSGSSGPPTAFTLNGMACAVT